MKDGRKEENMENKPRKEIRMSAEKRARRWPKERKIWKISQ